MKNSTSISRPRRAFAWTLALVLCGLLGGLLAAPAAAFKTRAKQVLLLDMSTGQDLFAKAADESMAPSSMTKLMTVYLLFEAIKGGQVGLKDEVTVSRKAARMRGSRMGIKAGAKVTILQLIRGLIVGSGNDAAVAVAEALAGSETAFVEKMNAKASALGLARSRFVNASGRHHPGQHMTARDIATLSARLIRDFPKFYAYFAETTFRYGKRRKPLTNRNPLLFKQGFGADGLKTGHTRAGGYGLAASARRGNRRLILVINGLESVRVRASEAQRLLNWGFRGFANYPLFGAGAEIARADVWLGAAEQVPLVTAGDVVVSLPKRGRPAMKVAVVYAGPIAAPIRKGDRIARLIVTAPGAPKREFPLLAGADVGPADFFGRVLVGVGLLIDDLLK